MIKLFLSTICAIALGAVLPAPASAQIPDAPSYADSQCGNGNWEVLGYPSYSSCYATAIDFYNEYTGGGGSGGGGGGGGGTFIGDIPGYSAGNVNPCKSRLCDAGNDPL